MDKHFDFQPLAEGVYAGISGANAGVVDLGDQTLIFDTTALLSAGRELRETARELTGRPAAYIINSHMHPDHIQGNAAFDGEGIILSSRVTREVILAEGAARLERMRSQFAARGMGPEFFAGYPTVADLRPPVLTFEHSLTFHGSKRTARLMTFGGAHSPCDAVLWLPAEQILFVGDLVIPGGSMILSAGGIPERWPGVLDQLEALSPALLVPGHGPCVPAAEGFAWGRSFLQHMFQLAGQAMAAGEPPDYADRAPVPDGYSEFWFRKDLRFLMERRLA